MCERVARGSQERKMGLSIKRMSDDYDYSFQNESSAGTTIGDLIKEKLDVSKLPEGPSDS